MAFRQPRKGITQIKYDDLILNLKDVFFRYEKDGRQIALELHIRGFYEAPEWTGAIFVMLDNLLGEYHTEISLSRIDKKLLNENEIYDLHEINDLPKLIKDYHLFE